MINEKIYKNIKNLLVKVWSYTSVSRDGTEYIADIPEIPKEIITAAKSGKLVVFVGAGVSRIIGGPSWNDFAYSYLEYLYKNKCLNRYEYKNLSNLDARKLLSVCKNIVKEEEDKKKDIKPPIKSLLKDNESLKRKYKIYESIYAWNCIYLTTNYDDNLDEIALKPEQEILTVSNPTLNPNNVKKSNKINRVIYSEEDLLISNLHNGVVIHIHGSIKDERNIIMTIVDYMKHYKEGSKSAELLKEIFRSYTVIFVGYGLEEYEILEFIVSKSKTAKDELKHFMLYPILKKEINLLKFQRKYYADLGIQLIPYSIDKNGYEHLATVVCEWAKYIGPIARPQNFLDRVKLIDEVI